MRIRGWGERADRKRQNQRFSKLVQLVCTPTAISMDLHNRVQSDKILPNCSIIVDQKWK